MVRAAWLIAVLLASGCRLEPKGLAADAATDDGAPVPDAAPIDDARAPDAFSITCTSPCTEVPNAGLCHCNVGETWTEARDACENLGLELAAVRDMAVQDAIEAYLDSAGPNSVWLGGSDTAAEGEFVWLAGDQFWMGDASGQAPAGAYARFLGGEPNDAPPGEDCLATTPSGWNDNPCDASLGYLCGAPP